MASINRLVAGQEVYSIQTQKMGNTTISRRVLYVVRVIEIDREKGYVFASWNGNTPKKFHDRDIKKWRVKKPEPKSFICGLPSY